MNCNRPTEQLILYLADALDPTEAQELEQHLQQRCCRCMDQLAEARRLLDEIPLVVEPKQPRPDARQRLMARIEAMSAGPCEGGGVQPTTGLPSRSHRETWSIGRIWGACAAAAALAATITFAVMDRQVERQADELARLHGQIAQYDERLTEYSSRTMRLQQLADIAGELYATLRSSPLEMIRMEGVDEYENASARLIWDRSRNVGHFLGPEDFRPHDGRRLKLWFVSNDDEARSAGTFSLDDFGWARFDIGMSEAERPSFQSAFISYDDAETPDNKVLLSGNF